MRGQGERRQRVVKGEAKRVSAARASAGKPADAARPGRRERNKQEKLKRIVDAARSLFAAKGFAETTTQEIAEMADIGTGTLFLYAKSKEDLLVMVFKDEMIETSLAAFEKAPANGSLLDQLMHVFNSMIAYHNRDIELARALIKEIAILSTPERRADIRSLMRVIYGGIADLIIANQKAGTVRADVDPAVAAEALFAIYYISLIGWLGGQQNKPRFIKHLRQMLAVAIDGLTQGKP